MHRHDSGFQDAGVDHPDGSYREIFTEEELCEERWPTAPAIGNPISIAYGR